LFECTREGFIKVRGIKNPPTFSYLQNFYKENFWRIDPFEDPEAVNCYERLFDFWSYYKTETKPLIWAFLLVFFGLMYIGFKAG
jgi:hypothetical protein